MRLDGFGLFVEDMAKMIRFYRDVLGFEIKESVLPDVPITVLVATTRRAGIRGRGKS